MLSASEEATPSVIYHCALRGLERLLLSEQLSRMDAETLVKLSVDRVNMPSPHRAMAALGLMLTCMYTGVPGEEGRTHFSSLLPPPPIPPTDPPTNKHPATEQNSPSFILTHLTNTQHSLHIVFTVRRGKGAHFILLE